MILRSQHRNKIVSTSFHLAQEHPCSYLLPQMWSTTRGTEISWNCLWNVILKVLFNKHSQLHDQVKKQNCDAFARKSQLELRFGELKAFDMSYQQYFFDSHELNLRPSNLNFFIKEQLDSLTLFVRNVCWLNFVILSEEHQNVMNTLKAFQNQVELKSERIGPRHKFAKQFMMKVFSKLQNR